VSQTSERLTALRIYLEDLGPSPKLTDAEIGMIVIYVRDHFPQTDKKQAQSVALVVQKAQ
jgi:hypothetical protein